MGEQELTRILKDHGLRKTDIRMEVLRVFSNQGQAYSQQDLQKAVGDVDRVTLYRTLKSFEKKGLIHRAIDGTDQAKYALCQEECSVHDHQDDHAHFHCIQCGKTTCIDDVQVPDVQIPKGYLLAEAQLVLRGWCDQCRS